MLDTKDLYWLAGLIEGEGCFSFRSRKGARKRWPRSKDIPCIYIRMTDKDVIEKAAKLTNKKVYGPYKSKLGHKDSWSIEINGRFAIAWMMTLYPLLCQRRQNRIEEIISYWRKPCHE